MNPFFKLFKYLFVFFLATFLVGGLVIVLSQTVGLIMLDGERITAVKENIAPWVFGAATLCAICAFVLGYSPEARRARKRQMEAEREENQKNRKGVEEDFRRRRQERHERRHPKNGHPDDPHPGRATRRQTPASDED